MRSYLITITRQDGGQCQFNGIFQDDWQAIDVATDVFFDARRVSARRLP